MSCKCKRATGWLCFSGLLMMVAPGCGANLYATARVSGTVTCNGKPVSGGTIVFQPVEAPEKTGRPKSQPGQASTGIIGTDGKFSLMLDPVGNDRGRVGALTGPHEVTFIMPEQDKLTADDERLPPEELAKRKAEVEKQPALAVIECGRSIVPDTVEVKTSGNNFEFKLLSKADDPPPSEGKRGHFGHREHIKVDPSKLEALKQTAK